MFFISFLVDSFKERFELRVKINADEGSGSNKEHTEYRDDRRMDFAHRRHIQSQHDNDHTEHDEDEGQQRLSCESTAECGDWLWT